MVHVSICTVKKTCPSTLFTNLKSNEENGTQLKVNIVIEKAALPLSPDEYHPNKLENPAVFLIHFIRIKHPHGLILIFRSVLWSQAFIVRRTHFLSVETTIYLFFNYYPVENRLEKRYSLKKELCMSYVVFLYKSGPIENP